jgi:alpha,alpha-trehalase
MSSVGWLLVRFRLLLQSLSLRVGSHSVAGVAGLRRYGYNVEADRISIKFLSMVLVNFERDANIREKYNVVTDSSNVKLAEGYRDNIIGFGWTNAVFLELLNELPADQIERIPTTPGGVGRQ